MFKCIVTNNDVFNDCYKLELIDDLYYVVHGKFKTYNDKFDDSMFGGNKSAEATDEGDSNEIVATKPDLIDATGLEEIAPDIIDTDNYYSGKDAKQKWSEPFRDFVKRIAKNIKEKQGEDEKKAFQEKVTPFINDIIKNAKKRKMRFFSTSGDYVVNGVIVFFENMGPNKDEEDPETKFKLFVLKDALYEEKY